MNARTFAVGLGAAVLLAGCEPVPVETAPPAPPDDCRASTFQGLVGQPVEALAVMTFPIGTRRIGPNDAVTADFQPGRLNIEYGASGRIEKVACY